MKKLMFLTTAPVTMFLGAIALSALIFIGCSKKDKNEGNEKENHCPVIAATAVPKVVKDSFAVRYPALTVTTWFQKDSVAFCAYFITAANVEKLAQFANNGSFIKEEIEAHQEGQYEDSTATGGKTGTGCECDTEKKGD